MIHYYAFVCLLLCIKLYLCDSDIYVIVIFDMCALYFESCICHITCVILICAASAFNSDANELYYLYSCLFHIFWVHHVGLGHVSLPNIFVLIDKSLYDSSMLKTSTLSHTRGGIGPVRWSESWLKLAEKYCSGRIVVSEKHCFGWKNKPNKPNMG